MSPALPSLARQCFHRSPWGRAAPNGCGLGPRPAAAGGAGDGRERHPLRWHTPPCRLSRRPALVATPPPPSPVPSPPPSLSTHAPFPTLHPFRIAVLFWSHGFVFFPHFPRPSTLFEFFSPPPPFREYQRRSLPKPASVHSYGIFGCARPPMPKQALLFSFFVWVWAMAAAPMHVGSAGAPAPLAGPGPVGAPAAGGPPIAGAPPGAIGVPGTPAAAGAAPTAAAAPPAPPPVWDFTQRRHLELVFAYGAGGKWEWANSAIDAGFPLSSTNTSDGATMLHVAVARVGGGGHGRRGVKTVQVPFFSSSHLVCSFCCGSVRREWRPQTPFLPLAPRVIVARFFGRAGAGAAAGPPWEGEGAESLTVGGCRRAWGFTRPRQVPPPPLPPYNCSPHPPFTYPILATRATCQ